MTAVWSVILMLMGWLPGNGSAAPQGPAANAPDSPQSAPPAYISVNNQLERDQRQALALERSA